MSRAVVCVCLCVCVLHVCVGTGSRVLVVFPVPSRSHTALGDSIVKILLAAGHQVTYVSPSTSVLQNERLTRVNISSIAESVSDKERPSLMEVVRSPRPPQKVLEVGTALARRALTHTAMQQLLKDTAQEFDVVVAEWFFTGLLAPLASVFKCPLIWYSGVDASWMNLQLMHGHTNPAYSVDPQARSMAAGFSVSERATRLWNQAYLTAWVYYMMYYVESSLYHEVYREALALRALPPPDYETLVYNGSMLLLNSQPVLGQTLPLPPNTKYVGGHHIGEPNQLPKKLQHLLDISTHGVIFFNLGSNIKSKDLPERMRRKLLDVFGHLEQTVIWKFEESLMGVPKNVHILNRTPQSSILNHTNTVLFITHGGFLSCLEATYFGIPIVGIPLFGDQFLTTELVVARGRGIRVDFTPDLPYSIYDAVHKVLGNSSYRSNAQQASAIFRHTLVPPGEELLHWVEVVVCHGADHLRSPAVQLSITQSLHMDLLVLGIMLLWFASKVLKVIKVHWNSHDVEEKKNL